MPKPIVVLYRSLLAGFIEWRLSLALYPSREMNIYLSSVAGTAVVPIPVYQSRLNLCAAAAKKPF